MRQGSESVATASAETAEGNHDLSSRTESQASAPEETAASREELGSTVKQNADRPPANQFGDERLQGRDLKAEESSARWSKP